MRKEFVLFSEKDIVYISKVFSLNSPIVKFSRKNHNQGVHFTVQSDSVNLNKIEDIEGCKIRNGL